VKLELFMLLFLHIILYGLGTCGVTSVFWMDFKESLVVHEGVSNTDLAFNMLYIHNFCLI